MSFFKDFKEDLSQAVNELMPEESAPVAPAAPVAEPADTGFNPDDLADMLKNIEEVQTEVPVAPVVETAPVVEPEYTAPVAPAAPTYVAPAIEEPVAPAAPKALTTPPLNIKSLAIAPFVPELPIPAPSTVPLAVTSAPLKTKLLATTCSASLLL